MKLQSLALTFCILHGRVASLQSNFELRINLTYEDETTLTLGGPGINTTSLDRAGYFNPHMQKCYLLIPT